jgi:hypothetical protein
VNEGVFLLNIRMHPVLRSHHRIRVNTYQGIKANPVANAGNASETVNGIRPTNAVIRRIRRRILSGIPPAIRNRIMYSPGPLFKVRPFLSISRLFQSHRPKKAKTMSPATVPR